MVLRRRTYRDTVWRLVFFLLCFFAVLLDFSPLAAPSDEARPPSSIAFGARNKPGLPLLRPFSLSVRLLLSPPLGRYLPRALSPRGRRGQKRATTANTTTATTHKRLLRGRRSTRSTRVSNAAVRAPARPRSGRRGHPPRWCRTLLGPVPRATRVRKEG